MRLWRGLSTRLFGAEEVEWLVVGLGNPGPRYEGTRHNVGRVVVADLAERWSTALDELRSDARFGVADFGRLSVALAVPILYMNESGRAVGPLSLHFRVEPDRVLVLHDDLDLPLGSMRMRASGGSGGHRGVASIIDALGTRDFPRLRLGIGRPPGRQDATDYVLSQFEASETVEVEIMTREAIDAVEMLLGDGISAAMNTYNR
jgi:PTH1 family peptidyl-tRNA hydrolase